MASACAALRRASTLKAQAMHGVVRIAASPVIGVEVLPVMLADFRERHPGIVMELSLSNQPEDLLRRDADIAVRMVRPTQEALVVRHVGDIALGFHAHKRYLQAHGRPRSLADLSGHALIGFDHETDYIRAMRPKGMPYMRENFSLRTDDDLAALAAIRAGFGIGICQLGVARRDPALVRLLPAIAIHMDTWVAMHEDLRRNAPARALFTYLADGLIDYAAKGRVVRRSRGKLKR